MNQQPGRVHVAATRNPAVFEGQIGALYRQLPLLLAYSVVVTIVLALMLRNAVSMFNIALWVAVMLAVMLARLVLYFRHRSHTNQVPTLSWAQRYTVLAGLSGLAWGMAGVVLFAPGQIEMQAIVLLVLAGMAAASAAVLPMYLPAFFAFVPAIMVPPGVMMFLQGDSFHLFMGVVDVIFLLGVLTFGKAIGDAFRTSLELRFENIDLVAELQRQKGELERANQAKSKFLAAASHDLRQPMHALSLFAQMLQDQAAEDRIRSLASHISNAVGVLERMFAALLDISRLDAGVMESQVSVFPIQDVLDHVLNDCRPQAEEKGLELVAPDSPLCTRSDPTLLESIVRNLLTNAIRYTESGTITLVCEARDDALIFAVHDTGIGIEEGNLDLIFEEFSQLHNPERDRDKGMGLGLSIVARLSRLLDHPLDVQSSPGKGSTFTLTLPMVDAGAVPQRPANPATPQRDLNLAVLVVDDDREVLAGTSALLESWGCQVSQAATAGEALALAQDSGTLDAIVTDLRLPDEERGTRLVNKIRVLTGREVPALLVTGDTEPERLREAKEYGIALLHKPVKPARLRRWLQGLPSA